MTVYYKRIKTFREYGKGYKKYSHNEGINLLRYAIMKETEISFSEEDIAFAEKGKPYFLSIDKKFSISHCDGLCVCAVSDMEIGIDCETIRKKSDNVIKRCYSDKEKLYIDSNENQNVAFTRLWTLKECYCKMTGDGVSSDLKSVSFDLGKNCAEFDANCSFHQLYLGDDFVISLCDSGKSGNTIIKDYCNNPDCDEIKQFMFSEY